MGLTRGCLLLVLALWASPLWAQTPPAVVTASLTSGVCTTEGATSAGCVTLNVAGQASLGIQVTGTWVGTLTFKASIDRANFATLQCTPPNSSSTATTTTGNGQWSCSVAGLAMAEVIFSAYTSGTAVVTLQSALAGGGSGGGGGGAASSVTINDPSVTSQKAAVNASGQLSITCANCTGSGASAVDRSVFTFGTTSGAPSGGVFDDTPPTALTAGMFAVPRLTANRAFHVNFRNQAGTEIGTAATPIQVSLANTAANATAVKVDGSAVTQPVGGTVAISTAFLLDATYTGRMPAGASPADAESNTNTALSRIGLFHFIFNGTSWDRVRGAANALNSTGTGIPTAQIVGQFDDVAPTAITENQFGNLRMSANRNLYGTIRDAAGNERGANVSAGNALLVDASATTQPVSNAGTFATQSAITAASGSIASGAIASGAVASGAYASGSISDGAEVTLGAKADAKSTATDTTAVSIMSVLKEISALEQAPASRAVTNAGTFADQATLQTQTDTVMVGGVNIKEINGVAPLMGAGATGTGALRVNDVASSATGAAPPASAIYTGGLGSGATGGFLIGASVGDTPKAINISTATTTLMITGVSGRQVHITSFHMLTAGANNVAWIEGTGATCGTGTAGMAGGTTAASGYNFAANGGIAIGSGVGDVLTTATTGDSVCLVTSAAVQLSGFIKYAIY